jgi:hypothetical protein
MPKTTSGRGGKETITPPTKRETSAASRDLRRGDSSGGRTMADASVARRQGVTPKKK